jgi:hypothetical protein
MEGTHKVGDLVHIPQSVDLIEYNPQDDYNAQLTIPLRVSETQAPSIGVITRRAEDGYVRVYCNGTNWAVKGRNVYPLART